MSRSKMAQLFRALPVLFVGACLVLPLRAYDLIRGPEGARVTWDDGTVPLVIRMATAPVLQDGTNYATSVQAAAQTWNQQLARVQFATEVVSPGWAGSFNGRNEVVFDSTIYSNEGGTDFFGPNILAVTVSYRSASPRADGTYERVEADVIFNSALNWNSYRGGLQTTEDIRRVALHELGHVLGLDHPDEDGQSVAAIMNSTASSLDALRPDDLNGAQLVYGKPGGFTAPANDSFANAIALTSISNVTANGSNIGATTEAEEPAHVSGKTGGSSVWWKWTAVGNGSVTVSTEGSHFDTMLAVYLGDALSSLTPLASNDDSLSGGTRTSSVTFPVSSQTEYHIAVDGWDAEWGQIELTLRFTPGPGPQPPAFQGHPQNVSVADGGAVTFTAYPVGDPAPTIKWQRRAAGSSDWMDLSADQNFRDVTTGTLRIRIATAEMHGDQFRAVVTNLYGSTPSQPATLTVTPSAPRIPEQPPSWVYAAVGTSAVITVDARGTAPLTYTWFKDLAELGGENGPTLQVPVTAHSTNVGPSYRVRVTNALGEVWSNGTRIQSVVPPIIAKQPEGVVAIAGTSVTFTVVAENVGNFSTFRWYRNGTLLVEQNSPSYTRNNVQLADTGDYHVEISNVAGTVTSAPGTLTVIPVPPPKNIRVELSGTSYVGISYLDPAWGGSPNIQWYRDGVPIPGATSQHYWFDTSPGANPSGRYFATITNPAGVGVSDTLEYPMAPSAPQSGSPRWIEAQEIGGVAYFLFADTPRIERYSVISRSWLSTWTLSFVPTTFAFAADAIYVAHAGGITKFDRTLGAPTLVSNFANARSLLVRGEQLFAATYDYPQALYRTFHRHSGAQLGAAAVTYGAHLGVSYSAATGRIYLRRTVVDPADIVYLVWNSDGTFGASADSPYHGEFSTATFTRVIGQGFGVVENNGVVYDLGTLEAKAFLGPGFDDLCESADGMLYVLRRGRISSYDAALRAVGSGSLGAPAQAMFIYGPEIFGFSIPTTAGARPGVGSIARSSIQHSLPPQASPVDAVVWSPRIEIDGENGVAYVHSKLHQNVFRWSALTGQYLPSIPVTGFPNHLGLSAANSRLYYDDREGVIRYVALGSGAQAALTSLVVPPPALQPTDRHLLAVGGRNRHLVFSETGALTDWPQSFGKQTAQIAWDPVHRRAYFVNSSRRLERTVIGVDGRIGNSQESPLVESLIGPVRVAPDGSQVVSASGHVLSGNNLALLGQLPIAVIDASWVEKDLFTVELHPFGTRVAAWSGFNTRARTAVFAGQPLRLANIRGDLLLLVTSEAGKLRFRTLSPQTLAELTVAELNRAPTASFTLSAERRPGETISINLQVDDLDGNFHYANLWVQSPTQGWRAVRANGTLVATAEASAVHAVALQPGQHTVAFLFDDGPGSYRFRLQAFDQAGAASTPLESVISVQDPLTPFQQWQELHFGGADLADPSRSGFTADPDADGMSNLLEYALGTNPTATDGAIDHATSVNDAEWFYVYSRPAHRPDLIYAVEVCSDLESWTTQGVTHEQVSANGDRTTWRARHARTTAPLFFRLKVTSP